VNSDRAGPRGLTASPPFSKYAIDNHSQLSDISRRYGLETVPMIVCVCNRVNEARVKAAISAGAETAEEVYAGCGVERNCGLCLETIEDMLAEADERLSKAA
jgi:bacterioferritin-associated ferredoxin